MSLRELIEELEGHARRHGDGDEVTVEREADGAGGFTHVVYVGDVTGAAWETSE